MKEPLLEPWLRSLRIRGVMPYISRYPNCDLLDIGCGWEAKLLRAIEPQITTGTGIDFKAPLLPGGKIRTISARLDTKLPFEDSSFDLITMLAVLEHLQYPKEILNECSRLLRPGGGLLITVPSKYAKPVLEFLAFKVGIVNPDEIRDHKQYFNREDLFAIFKGIPSLKIIEHKYFQWRFNNKLFAEKQLPN